MRQRKIKKAILFFLMTLFGILFLAQVILNFPFVQRYITKKVNEILINAKVPISINSIGKISTNSIVINGVFLFDANNDTIIYTENISATFSPIDLLYRRVIIPSATLVNANIRFLRNNRGEKINIAEAFSKTGSKKVKKAGTVKKPWEVSFEGLKISGLKFQMHDSVEGIFIDEDIFSLKAKTEKMSIIDKAIIVQSLYIKGASGGILLNQEPKESGSGSIGTPWNFGLYKVTLNEISNTYNDVVKRMLLRVSIEEGQINARKTDIKNKILDFSNIYISGASTSMQMDKKSNKLQERKIEAASNFPWNISSSGLDLENISFQMGAYSDIATTGLDSNLTFKKLTLSLSDMELSNKRVGVTVNKMNVDLQNGFSLLKAKGKIDSRGRTTQFNLFLETGNSLVNMDGKTECSFFDLIKKPEIISEANATIKNTHFSLKDFLYFKSDTTYQSLINTLAKEPISINGTIALKDSVISMSGLSIYHAQNIGIHLQGTITNRFRPEFASGDLQFGISVINTLWLSEMLTNTGLKFKMPEISSLSLEGTVSGTVNAPIGKLTILSDLGTIEMKGSYDTPKDSFQLNSIFEGVMLDRILGKPEMGKFAGNVEISGKGIKQKHILAEVSMSIDSIRFKGYDYTKGTIIGIMEPSKYSFQCIVDDPSLNLDLTADINTENSTLKATTSGTFMAKLNDLHLYEDTLAIAGRLTAFFNKNAHSLKADLNLADLKVITPQKELYVGQLNTTFTADTLKTTLSGKSDFYTISVQVGKPVSELKSIIDGYKKYLKSFKDPKQMDAKERITYLPEMKATIEIKYHEGFENLLKGFYFDNIGLDLVNNPADRVLRYSIKSNGIKFKKVEIENLNTQIIDSLGTMDFRITADRGTLFSQPINRLLLTNRSAKWHSLTNLSVIDKTNEVVYNFEIATTADSNTIFFKVPSKLVILNKVKWHLDSEEILTYRFDKKIVAPAVKMKTDDSFFQIIEEGEKDKRVITCELKNVGISSLVPKRIIKGNPDGLITGSVTYKPIMDKGMSINSDITFRNVSWSDMQFNFLKLKGTYLSEKPGEWQLDLDTRLDSTEIVCKGQKTGNGNTALNGEIKHFPLKTAEPFLEKVLSNLKGTVSGDFNFSSNESNKNLNGKVSISEGNLRVKTLNAEYRIPAGTVLFTGKKIVLDDFTVLDSLNNKLLIDGTLDISNPKAISTNLEVSSVNLQVLNRTEKDNAAFFGQVFVDSKLSIKGLVTSPEFKGTVLLTKGTEVFFSKKEDLSLSESEKVITFVSKNTLNSKRNLLIKSELAQHKGASIETFLEIDPHTKINFNLAQKLYTIDLMIQGGGALNYGMLENNQMNLSGKYEIGEGTANVKMIGWPNKLFQITSGGFIRWAGNIEDPTLQFEALNRVRTSYTNPIDGKLRYVDFNVMLKLSDRLSELKLVFTINTPDQYLMSIINTLSPDEQMRQAITILLFEKIDLPGISTSTDYVTEQVNQILASQLNSLTKTTVKGIDISFGIDTYTSASQSGGEKTNTSLSYDVKKSFMNDRAKVEISGRVNDYSNPQNSSNLSLNNLSFEYRLDSAGTKFIKVYNEHTYEDVFEGEVIKTGVGYIYRKSYPTLGDLWRRDNKKKKLKEAEK